MLPLKELAQSETSIDACLISIGMVARRRTA